MCRSRRELSNAYFVAKFGLNTAENEPCEVCPTEQCSSRDAATSKTTQAWIGVSTARVVDCVPTHAEPCYQWLRTNKLETKESLVAESPDRVVKIRLASDRINRILIRSEFCKHSSEISKLKLKGDFKHSVKDTMS